MSQLGQTLLRRVGSLCVFVNEQNLKGLSFFEQVGFELRSNYDAIFLERKQASSKAIELPDKN